MRRSARQLQHRRFGHVRSERLRQTTWSNWVQGLQYLGAHDRITCDCCMRMNAKKAPFDREAEERSSIPGERIHSDVKELPERSIEGHIYAVNFIDDATRRCVVYPIKKKSEVIAKFEHFLLTECAARGKAVRYLRSDHGGEYDSDEMEKFYAARGIWKEHSPPHCQSGNGVAEVAWRDTFKMVRAILEDQGRPPKYWAIALRFAAYLRNRLMTHAVLDMPPEAAWLGREIPLDHLRVPLSTCWAYIEKSNRTNTLGERRMKGVFVGYARHSPAYLVYVPETGRVYERRYADVEFDERSEEVRARDRDSKEDMAQLDAFLEKLDELTTVPGAEIEPAQKQDTPEPAAETTAGAAPAAREHEQPAEDKTEDVESWLRTTRDMTVEQLARFFNIDAGAYHKKLHEYDGWYQKLTSLKSKIAKGSDVPVPHGHRPSRRRRVEQAAQVKGVQLDASAAVRRHLRDTAAVSVEQALTVLWQESACSVLTHKDPKSVKQARARPDSQQWQDAMLKEWAGLWKKEAFAKVEKTGQKLHHMIWVFKRKGDGTYKARLCFDGRRQDPTTYSNIASPTMKLTSLRILLGLAAQHGWPVWADDATQAFLNAPRPADKPLYATYPEGFRDKENKHCLLVRRMLYGLHDAPMGWFLEVKRHLIEEQGFTQSKNDACLFHKPGVWVVCHVDDFASTGEPEKVKEFRAQLHKRFKMTGGQAKEYYGLEVSQDLGQGTIKLSCRKYLEKAMQKLGLQAKPWHTPMDSTLVLRHRAADEPPNPILQRRYRQLVGTAMHPSVTCRPDAAAAVRALSVHLQNPGAEHVKAAERVMQYLHHTRRMTLTWSKRQRFMSSFLGTCDAAHNVTKDSKGITGWAYQFAGGAVSWKCGAQGLTALSSTEAELIAVDEAAREAQYLHKLLQDFGINVSEHVPTTVYQDNQSTIKLIHSEHWNARTKHVALRYHHTGDLVRDRKIQIVYLPTDQMPADILTKPLPKEAFQRHRAVLLGLVALRLPPLQHQQQDFFS